MRINKSVLLMVDYTPHSKLTNAFIMAYNSRASREDAADLAREFASQIAAVAYCLRGTNSEEKVKSLLAAIVDDACKQYANREALLKANENKPN